MKSNKDKEVFELYEYANGTSVSMTNSIQDCIEDHRNMKLDLLHDWVDNDSLFLPRDMFAITLLTLDKDGDASSIEFTERRGRR